MPPFTIHATTPADAEAQMAMGLRAFANDSLNQAIFPARLIDPANPHEQAEWRLGRLRKRLENPDGSWWTCVDEGADGRIVGSAGWIRLNREAELEKAKEKKEEEFPKCADPQLIGVMEKAMEEGKRKWTGEMDVMWYLAHLATDPDYQGKGIGRSLVQRGFDEVDREGVPAYLEATAAGVRLYKSMGFEILEELTFSGVMNGDKPATLTLMLRQPKGNMNGTANEEEKAMGKADGKVEEQAEALADVPVL